MVRDLTPLPVFIVLMEFPDLQPDWPEGSIRWRLEVAQFARLFSQPSQLHGIPFDTGALGLQSQLACKIAQQNYQN